MTPPHERRPRKKIGTDAASPVPNSIRELPGHLAHEVALAEFDAVMAQDVVSGRDMEIEVRQSMVIEENIGLEGTVIRTKLHGHAALFLAIDLRGIESLQEVDGRRNPHLQNGDGAALLEVRELRTRNPSGSDRMRSRLLNLASEGKHVRRQP